jgi:class 3 adenylate cyclase/pimeloyl-ACP methyl ester carboxylesterase
MARRLAAILAADVAGYSRLMNADEAGTLAALLAHRSEVIAPSIARHRGRIVKLIGDGILAEFESVVEAVECAVEVQRTMAERNRGKPDENRMLFRMGVHLGDIIVDGDDIYGDGVNIAARLEGLAEAGGIDISRQAYDQVDRKLPFNFRTLGPQKLKNIPRPVEVYAVDLGEGARKVSNHASRGQEITFCQTKDGVNLAAACVGQGMPLVRTSHWFTHIEYEWQNPFRAPLLHFLADRFRLIRYDGRCNGLSDWDVADVSFEALQHDLDTVVDALGLRSYSLLGMSQGASMSIAHAVRYPERVSKIVLLGAYALGWNKRGPRRGLDVKTFLTLMREGWGDEHSAFQKMLCTGLLPNASAEQIKWLAELQRMASSPENTVRLRSVFDEIDVIDLLPKVSAPTLVLHCRHDNLVPFEEGRRIATLIPNAKFVALESENHVPHSFEPAWPRFLEAVESFLLAV